MSAEYPALEPNLTQQVLSHLGVPAGAPSVEQLARLLRAYAEIVPWETASRIMRRAACDALSDCPRWPEEFWRDNFEHGSGGTCFESNYAFMALLQSLGYSGYLTINDMGDVRGCHTAILIFVNGQKLLVDVGIPLYAPLPVDANVVTDFYTPFHTYTTRPEGKAVWQIERDLHPRPNIYTLIDKPVGDAVYRRALTDDYIPNSGLFLDKLVLNKVIDGMQYRFNSAESADYYQHFHRGRFFRHPMHDDVATTLSVAFDIEHSIIARALDILDLETTKVDPHSFPTR